MFTLLCKNKLGLLLLIFVALSFISSAQQKYLISLTNGVQVNNTTYEFDIFIKAQESDFLLTSYQVLLNFNDKLVNEGDLSFTYIEGTSELSNIPSIRIGVQNFDKKSKFSFASTPGTDSVLSAEKRIGRFRVTNSVSFNDPQISWSFGEDNSTLLTGASFVNITNPSFHQNYINGTVSSEENKIVMDYFLDQNYPNPFNPSTNIAFGLKENGFVKLTVYNALGETVKILANENMEKGYHLIKFDAASLASGVYFYKLEVNKQFTNIKKMIFMK